jgi:hypothetical protein
MTARWADKAKSLSVEDGKKKIEEVEKKYELENAAQAEVELEMEGKSEVRNRIEIN